MRYVLEHPAALLPSRSPEHRDIFHADFRRIVLLLNGYRPVSTDDFRELDDSDFQRLAETSGRIALDLETDRRSNDVDMVGLAYNATEARILRLPNPTFLTRLADVLSGREIIVHYGEGLEMPWLMRLYEGPPPLVVHDLHKLFYAYDPEYARSGGGEDTASRKGGSGALAFVQSILSWRPYHKHLLAQCYNKWKLVTPELKAHYCMLDTVVTWECFHRLETACRSEQPAAWGAYERDAVPLLPIMVAGTQRGWLVDQGAFEGRRAGLLVEASGAATAVLDHYGAAVKPKGKKVKTPISIRGLKAELTRQGIKLPLSAKGNPVLDRKTREKLLPKHPELADVNRYFEMQDCLGDFYSPKIIDDDGRVRPEASGYLVSWRWRYSKDPAQRPPAERGIYVADPGSLLGQFDTDMGEYRWFAGECQDPNLLQDIAEYDAGRAPKPHCKNAAILFKASEEEAAMWRKEQHPHHARYVFSKNYIYRLMYSYTGGVDALRDAAAKSGLTFSRKDIVAMDEEWLGRYPTAARWRRRHVEAALRTRCVTCREWGYLRKFHGLTFENEALNFPMQAGIAGLVNRTVRLVHQQLGLVPLVNTRDGLVYQVREDMHTDRVIYTIRETWLAPLATLGGMVIPVEVRVGRRWGHLKEWSP